MSLFVFYAETYDVKVVSSLEALLGSYSSQGDLKMGAKLAEKLQNLKPFDETSYVVLSNMYSASGQWKQAASLRKAMTERGVKKMPGCSWIEVRNRVEAFVAGSTSFPCLEDVQMMLCVLESEMKYPMSISFLDGISGDCVWIGEF